MTITRRRYQDMSIAGLRFTGTFDDVPAQFERLHALVAPHIAGPGLCLYHRLDREQGHDLEVCFPVADDTPEADPALTRWVLPGGDYLCLDGPVDEMRKAWGQLWAHSVDQHITWADSVLYRELHLDADRIEIQAPLHMPVWLERLAEGLDREVGEVARRAIMAGDGDIYADTPAETRAAWAAVTLDRLDATVPDDARRKAILSGCAHVFPPERIQRAREWYLESNDIDALLDRMRQDNYYGLPEREGRVINTSKQPFNREQYDAATDPDEKRAAYCFCGIVQAAILAGQELSPTFCYCGLGWPKQLWEGILGEPLHVELVESILKGDERCSFAVHLPESVVTPPAD